MPRRLFGFIVSSDIPVQPGAKAADSQNSRYGGFLQAGSAFMGYAGVTLIGTALGGAFAIVNEAMIARFLGVEAYGRYAIAFMLARIGSILAAFGLPVTILHFLPIELNQRDKASAFGSVIGSILLPVVSGIGLSLSIWSLSDWFAVSIFHEPHAAVYIRNLAIVIPLIATTEVLGHIARGFGHALPYVVIRNLVPTLCYMCVILYLVHSGGAKVSITYGPVGAYATAAFLGFIVIGTLSWSTIGLVRPRIQLRALYSYSLPVFLNTAVSLVLVWTDLFQLGIFTNADTVGIYRACMQIVIVFDVIWTACSAASGPMYPVLILEGRLEQLRNTYLASIHVAALLATPAFLLILCNANDILGILGPRFSTGAFALSLLAFGNLVKVSFGAAGVLLVLGGRQRLEAANAVASSMLNVTLNYFLIPRFGLVGAATATTTSLLVLSLLRLRQVVRAFPVTSLDPAIFRVAFVTSPLALSFTWASRIFGFGQGTGIPHLLLRLFVLGLLIILAIWTVCLSEDERAMLSGLLSRKKHLAKTACPPVGE